MRKITRRQMLVGVTAAAIVTIAKAGDPKAAEVSQSLVQKILPKVSAGVPGVDREQIAWIVVVAMLRTTAYAEGTWGRGKDAYRTQYSYRVVPESYAYKKHPYWIDGVIPCSGGLCSAASGTFQFMPDTWNPLRQRHKNRFWFPGDEFSPGNQDLGAIYLMEDVGLWPLLFKDLAVKDGTPVVSRDSFARAISKAAPTWASFPRYEDDSSGVHGQGAKRVAPMWAFFQKQIKELAG